jgi:hypothetical protein
MDLGNRLPYSGVPKVAKLGATKCKENVDGLLATFMTFRGVWGRGAIPPATPRQDQLAQP